MGIGIHIGNRYRVEIKIQNGDIYKHSGDRYRVEINIQSGKIYIYIGDGYGELS